MKVTSHVYLQPEVERIIEKLAVRYKLTTKEVRAVIYSQFIAVKKVMLLAEKNKIETFKYIRLCNLGRFGPYIRGLKRMIEASKNKSND